MVDQMILVSLIATCLFVGLSFGTMVWSQLIVLSKIRPTLMQSGAPVATGFLILRRAGELDKYVSIMNASPESVGVVRRVRFLEKFSWMALIAAVVFVVPLLISG